jgi:CRISPR/Cas system CMR-associated protein Cmr5 small subunit
VIEAEDTEARFLLAGPDTSLADHERYLSILRDSWHQSASRQQVHDSTWISDLGQHLTHLVDLRVSHVDEWLKSNTQRFQAENSSMEEELRQAFNSAVIDLRASVQFCKSQCAACNLFCIQSRSHQGNHDCLTSHECIHHCTLCDKQASVQKNCGQM